MGGWNHISIVINSQCWGCCTDEETMVYEFSKKKKKNPWYYFLKCIYAHACWHGSHIRNEILLDSTSSFEDRFQAVLDCYSNINLSHSHQLIKLIIWIFWRIGRVEISLQYKNRTVGRAKIAITNWIYETCLDEKKSTWTVRKW